MFMKKHFDELVELYGDSYVQIPNSIFKTLSSNLEKEGKPDAHRLSFAYSYLAITAILYKYAHFVALGNESYIQNGDIKEILGYSRKTKTINKVISKGGILEQAGLIETTREYPVYVNSNKSESINGFEIRDFTTISMINSDHVNYNLIKSIVKNRNYEVSVPRFLFDSDQSEGTLHNYKNTHRVTVSELISLISNDEVSNVDMLVYFYLKSKCLSTTNKSRSMPVDYILSEIKINSKTYFSSLDNLEKKKYIGSIRQGWRIIEADEKYDKGIKPNTYFFKGVKPARAQI